jgi:hypothetical protein
VEVVGDRYEVEARRLRARGMADEIRRTVFFARERVAERRVHMSSAEACPFVDLGKPFRRDAQRERVLVTVHG